MKKHCKYHGQTLSSKRKDSYYRCKKCASESVVRRRRLVKEKAIAYKGGKCSICGYNKCNRALAFHHLDPETKDFSISHKGISRSWEKIKQELDKCILVCHNCHSELHENILREQNPDLYGRLNNFNPMSKRDPNRCSACDTEIFSFKATHCVKCSSKSKEKIKWPTTKELIEMINQSSRVSVAKQLGVSETSVRKRLKNHPVVD